jgi:hypothetical protein
MTETFNYDLERMKIAVNSPTVKLELYQMNKKILELIEIWDTSLTDDADFDDELSSLVKLVIEDVLCFVLDEVRYEAGTSVARTIEQEVKKHYGLLDESEN